MPPMGLAALEVAVDALLFELEHIPSDAESDVDVLYPSDEVTYAAEQLQYCSLLPLGSGAVVFNALVFFGHGLGKHTITPEWIQQHTTSSFVLVRLGDGYHAIILASLRAAADVLQRITCGEHPFHRLAQCGTGDAVRIPEGEAFQTSVRGWCPVWCENELFVRFAAAGDQCADYPVVFTDYDPFSTAAPRVLQAPVPPQPRDVTTSSPLSPASPLAMSPQFDAPGPPPNAAGGTPTEVPPAKRRRTAEEKAAAKKLKEASQGLPPGWRAYFDPNGNIYYGNGTTGAASWVRPVA
eukprot:TRINITY_DN4680_c0_g1_i1.p1 TRINITY_DN4680_c0_g1~~TRINITY_DN4680_c0_g1_i1.p1  ORF type:complete len:295 (-),score=42.25 TRINITY_DN4680_c0_g1_i1:36-920(-)